MSEHIRFVGLIIIVCFIGYLAQSEGHNAAMNKMQKEAISRNFGTYDSETLEFKWNEGIYMKLPKGVTDEKR